MKPIEFLCSGWRFSFFVLAGFFFTVFHQRPVDSKVSSIVLNSTSALIACGAIFLSIAAFPSLFCQYFMGAIIFLFEYFLAWNITSRPSSCRSTPAACGAWQAAPTRPACGAGLQASCRTFFALSAHERSRRKERERARGTRPPREGAGDVTAACGIRDRRVRDT